MKELYFGIFFYSKRYIIISIMVVIILLPLVIVNSCQRQRFICLLIDLQRAPQFIHRNYKINK